MVQRQLLPSVLKKCANHLTIKKTLRLVVHQEVVRLNLGMPPGTEMMVLGRVQATQQHTPRTEQQTDPVYNRQRILPTEIVQRQTGQHDPDALNRRRKRLAHVPTADRCRRRTHPGDGDGGTRQIKGDNL